MEALPLPALQLITGFRLEERHLRSDTKPVSTFARSAVHPLSGDCPYSFAPQVGTLREWQRVAPKVAAQAVKHITTEDWLRQQ